MLSGYERDANLFATEVLLPNEEIAEIPNTEDIIF